MEIQVLNPEGQPTDNMAVAESVFGRDFNETLVHQVVVAYLAAGRAGTRAQKTRSDVRGGGAKPFRQKGTGRARAGTIRSPLWRSGGVTFAARPQEYSQKINRKMYRAAMSSIFSELVRQQRLRVVNDLNLPEPKTREGIKLLQNLNAAQGKTLVILDSLDANLVLALRNVPHIALCSTATISPSELVDSDCVLITKSALSKVGEWLA